MLPQEKDINGADNAAKKVSFCKREKRCSTLLPVNNFGFDGLRFDEDDPFSTVSPIDYANTLSMLYKSSLGLMSRFAQKLRAG